MAALRTRYGRLPTGFVHAASLFELDTPRSTDWTAIEAHRRVNADTFVAAATAWVQHAQPDERGSFVSLVDQKVHRLNPDHYAYTLSKLTLAASIPFLAQTLAPQLRVNGVSPGTDLTQWRADDGRVSKRRRPRFRSVAGSHPQTSPAPCCFC